MSLPVQLAGCRDCGQTLYNCILCILICVKASPRVFNIFVSLASFALLVPPNSDLAKYSVSVCVDECVCVWECVGGVGNRAQRAVMRLLVLFINTQHRALIATHRICRKHRLHSPRKALYYACSGIGSGVRPYWPRERGGAL